MKTLVRACYSITLLVTLLFAGQPVQSANEIRIGALLPLTGDNASYGVDCRKGMELAIEEYNLRAGSKASLFIEDTKADPKTAVSAINKLISLNRPTIIVGDMFSNTTLAVAPIAQSNGIVLITPTAALETIPATGDHIFTIYPTSKYEGEFVASFAIKKGYSRFGIFKQQIQVAEEIGNAFAGRIKELKGEVVFSQVVPSGTKDYRNIVAKFRKAKVDAIFVSAYRDEAGSIIKQAREVGYKGSFLSQSSLYDENTIKLFGSAVNGVMFSAPYFNDQTESNKLSKFRRSYQKRFGNKPNIWAAYGYDVVTIALLALEKSEKSSRSLHVAVAEMRYDGVTGAMSFYPNRTVNKEMQMLRINETFFEKITR